MIKYLISSKEGEALVSSSTENDCLFIDKSDDEKHYGLRYARLIPVLVNAIKELSAKVTALEAG